MFETSKPFEEGVECLRKSEQTGAKTPVSLRNREQTGVRKTRSKPLEKDPGRMVADFGVRGSAWRPTCSHHQCTTASRRMER